MYFQVITKLSARNGILVYFVLIVVVSKCYHTLYLLEFIDDECFIVFEEKCNIRIQNERISLLSKKKGEEIKKKIGKRSIKKKNFFGYLVVKEFLFIPISKLSHLSSFFLPCIPFQSIFSPSSSQKR